MITALVKKSQIREMFIEIGELWPTGLKEGNEKADSMKWVKRMVAFYNGKAIPIIIHCFSKLFEHYKSYLS